MIQDIDFSALRNAMVAHQLQGRGVCSPLVIEAMRRVPREALVPDSERARAYEDGTLAIGSGQNISQPSSVAQMAEALDLRGGERVLDIGTGSGYGAAVLACMASRVYSIERIPELAERAARILADQGFDNVTVHCGDGTLGWPEQAPFEGIVVAAGAPAVPAALQQQLAVGGHLVIPVGSVQGVQSLLRVTRVSEQAFETRDLGGVRFVPLLGEQGWS